jgi:hypothetical protein
VVVAYARGAMESLAPGGEMHNSPVWMHYFSLGVFLLTGRREGERRGDRLMDGWAGMQYWEAAS